MALFRIAQDANRVFTALSANVAASVVVESLIPRYTADQNLIWKFVFGYLAYTGAYMGALDIASVLIPIYPFSQLYPLVVLGPIMLPDALRRLRDVSGAIGDELRGAIHRVFGTKPEEEEPFEPIPEHGTVLPPFPSPSECKVTTDCNVLYLRHWQPSYKGEPTPSEAFRLHPRFRDEQIYYAPIPQGQEEYYSVDNAFNERYPLAPAHAQRVNPKSWVKKTSHDHSEHDRDHSCNGWRGYSSGESPLEYDARCRDKRSELPEPMPDTEERPPHELTDEERARRQESFDSRHDSRHTLDCSGGYPGYSASGMMFSEWSARCREERLNE